MLVLVCKLLCRRLGGGEVQAARLDSSPPSTNRRRPRLPAAISNLAWRLDGVENEAIIVDGACGLRLLNALIRQRATFAHWKRHVGEIREDSSQVTSCSSQSTGAELSGQALFDVLRCLTRAADSTDPHTSHEVGISLKSSKVKAAEVDENTCAQLSARVDSLQKQLDVANDAIEILEKEKRDRFDDLWHKVSQTMTCSSLISQLQAVAVGQEQLESFLEQNEAERKILLHRIHFLENVVREVNSLLALSRH